jgi:hypothetical protein
MYIHTYIYPRPHFIHHHITIDQPLSS